MGLLRIDKLPSLLLERPLLAELALLRRDNTPGNLARGVCRSERGHEDWEKGSRPKQFLAAPLGVPFNHSLMLSHHLIQSRRVFLKVHGVCDGAHAAGVSVGRLERLPSRGVARGGSRQRVYADADPRSPAIWRRTCESAWESERVQRRRTPGRAREMAISTRVELRPHPIFEKLAVVHKIAIYVAGKMGQRDA